MIIIVHHDLHKVSHYFDELIVLKNRLIAAGPVEQTFTAETLQEAYGDLLGDLLIQGLQNDSAFIDGLFRYQFYKMPFDVYNCRTHFRGNWFIHYFTWDVFDG